MKGRLSWLDIRASVNELQKVIGTHVKTVYSISKKAILIKFSNKEQLLIDSPSKFHLTYKEHAKINLTPMAMYLRKVLNNCRVEKIKQLGFDRIAAIQMGSAEGTLILVIEMYANGNIILLDKEMKILNLLRPVDHLGIVKDGFYPINEPQLSLDIDRFDYVSGNDLKKKLMNFVSLSGRVVEDILQEMNLFFQKECYITEPLTLETLNSLRQKDEISFLKAFNKYFSKVFERLTGVGNYGAVTYQGGRSVIFTPWKETTKETTKDIVEFDSFGKTMDAAFAVAEITETAAEKKRRKIIEAQKNSLESKLKEVQSLRAKADILSEHQLEITQIFDVIISAVESGISEEDFYRFKKESEETVPVAKIIQKIDLAKKTTTLLLDANKITVSYDKTIYEQMNTLYQQAKRTEEKANKARIALEESIKTSEEIKKKTVKLEQVERPVHWFEKFHWMITKDNDLIIAGRDSKQNEILIKKHLLDTDYYFHAEVQGGSSVIVGETATEETKNTAASMAMCLSKAWDKGVVSAVYSVRGSQVSKTAAPGEYLKQGSFVITGKREFYHPHRLEYGITIIYKHLSTPIEMHNNNRTITGLIPLTTETKETLSPDQTEYAIAMSGPYAALPTPKYKLLPGTAKKGMIIKEILALAEMDAPQHLKYLRSITGREMELTVISNSKLAQAEIVRRGTSSVFQRKDRKQKKAEAKNAKKN
ncbi:nuclear export mediator factor NEMF [Nematocida sp. AWRm80]|nr:nuclear export mediator factor NEMF [Nematocida sp. AWRm80]